MAQTKLNTPNKRLRRIVIAGVVLILLGITAYFGLGYYVYNTLTEVHPRCESVYMDGRRDFTPAYFEGVYDYPEITIDVSPYLMGAYETVEFPAREDGTTISAWFVEANTPSDKAVIVVHGGDVCRRNTSVLLPAGMLANHGFNVLLIDLRNHGDSEVVGQRGTAGSTEYKDVLGAFDWLLTQGFASEQIGLMGVSLGAATSTNAFGREPEIAALWEDSAFADIPTVLHDQLVMNGVPLFLGNAVLTVAKLDGTDLTAVAPVQEIQNHQGRPVMITHGTEDEWINVGSAYQLHAATGEQAQLWIIEGARHVEAMFIYPEEYTAKMVAFFEDALR